MYAFAVVSVTYKGVKLLDACVSSTLFVSFGFFFFFFGFFLAVLGGMWNPSSQTRNQTHVLCTGSVLTTGTPRSSHHSSPW